MTVFVCLSSSLKFINSSLHQVTDRQKSRQTGRGALIVRVLCATGALQCHHTGAETLGRRMSQRPLARLQRKCQPGACREKDANHRKTIFND